MNLIRNNLIMTATINVEGCPQLSRNNIETRKSDYINALNNFLQTTNLNIIFAENSNYDLSFLKNKFEAYTDRIEYISITQNTAIGKGKGHGEKDTLLFVLDNSYFLKDSDVFFKISGRYFSPDCESVISKNHDFYTLTRDYDRHVSTVFFGCNKNIFKQYFTLETEVNDLGKIFEEHVCDMVKDIHSKTPDKVTIIPSMKYVDTYVSDGMKFLDN